MSGAVRYQTTGDSERVVNCHCQSCRTHTGAPAVTLAVCKFPQVNSSGDERKIYNLSPGVGHAFCAGAS